MNAYPPVHPPVLSGQCLLLTNKTTWIRVNIGRDGYDWKHPPGGRFRGSMSAVAAAKTDSFPGAGGPCGPLSLSQNTIREGSGLLSSDIAVELDPYTPQS